MAKLSLVAGTTSKLLDVFIQDSSQPGSVNGLTGLTNASSGLTWYYYREGAASAVQVTSIASMTLGTWVTKGFIVIDGTNMPGMYQIGVPDAALAAGAKSVVMMLKGVTNMVPVLIEIELTAVDNQDAVRMGLTALPNANAEAAGGLFTRGTGAGQINQDANGRVDVSLKAILGTALTESAGQIAAAFKQFFNIATPAATMDHGILVDTVTTYTGNTKQTGDAYARLGAPAGASHAADVAAVKAVLPAALVGGRIDASVGAVASGVIAAASFAANALDAVWSTTTRLLTAGTNIVLAKGTGVTGLNDLDAAGVRAAAGLGSANLDTQLSAINSKTTNLPAAPADEALIIAATNALAAAIAALPTTTTVNAIKSKTDLLSFTVSGQVDANIQYVNDVLVTGNGDTGTEWGP